MSPPADSCFLSSVVQSETGERGSSALALRVAFYAAFVAWLPMPWPLTCCAFYEVFLTAYVYLDIFFIYTW